MINDRLGYFSFYEIGAATDQKISLKSVEKHMPLEVLNIPPLCPNPVFHWKTPKFKRKPVPHLKPSKPPIPIPQ
jgi:hypothetical protein